MAEGTASSSNSTSQAASPAAAGVATGEAAAAAQAAEAQTNETQADAGEAIAPSARDKFFERIKGYQPDGTFEGDDSYFDSAISLFDKYDGEKKRWDEANNKLMGLFRSEPELEGITLAVMKGMPVKAAIARYFSPEDLVSKEGDEDFSQYTEAVNERAKRLADRDKFEGEVETNLAASEAALREFAEENQLDEAATLELIDTVSELMDSLYKGVLPKDLLSHVHRSKSKDTEVSQALQDGIIQGKNEKIEAKMAEEKKTGDNVPVLQGGVTEQSRQEAPVVKSRLDRLVEREKRRKIL